MTTTRQKLRANEAARSFMQPKNTHSYVSKDMRDVISNNYLLKVILRIDSNFVTPVCKHQFWPLTITSHKL